MVPWEESNKDDYSRGTREPEPAPVPAKGTNSIRRIKQSEISATVSAGVGGIAIGHSKCCQGGKSEGSARSSGEKRAILRPQRSDGTSTWTGVELAASRRTTCIRVLTGPSSTWINIHQPSATWRNQIPPLQRWCYHHTRGLELGRLNARELAISSTCAGQGVHR